MKPGRRWGLIIVGGLVALIVTAVIVAALLFNINSYKPKIETAVSGVTGLDVRINGRMGLSFLPFGVSAKNIHVSGEGGELLSLERLRLGMKLIPLLRRRLEVTRCVLIKPNVTIVRNAEGEYNFESRERKRMEGRVPAFSLSDLKLSKGALLYLDKKTGEKTELKEIDLAVNGLSVADNARGIIKNVSFTGSFDCKEILQKDLRIENLKGSVKVDKGANEFEPLTIAALVYLEKETGEKTELKEISLALKNLSIGDTTGGIIKNVSFTGSFGCKEVMRKDLRIANLKGPVKADKGVFSFKPLTMDFLGGKGEGDVTADKSKTDDLYRINLKVSRLDFGKLQDSFGTKNVIGGRGDLSASLTVKEKGRRILLSNLDGTFSLGSDNLVTHTVDLDKILSSYETSQKFSLVDIGAFFIAGPLGSAALKGYRYGDLYYQTQGGQGTITRFVSHWKITNGKADATDCAFATRHHRVAAKGRLDLVNERYDDMVVALLDDKGCVKYQQSIRGSFDNPRIGDTVSRIGSLAGPIFDLYKKAKRIVQAGRCEVFYNGSVRQPR